MALTLLIFSACMPFIVFTYLLRGIDITTIGYALVLGFLACAAFNALGVFGGCAPASRALRSIIGLLTAYFGICGIGFLIGAIVNMSKYGVAWGFLGGASVWLYWAGVGTALLLEVLAIGLFYVFSVAMLSPKPANRMFVPHLYITVLWAITARWTFFGPGTWATPT